MISFASILAAALILAFVLTALALVVWREYHIYKKGKQ